jgi:CRP-like cAMP-binding protein
MPGSVLNLIANSLFARLTKADQSAVRALAQRVELSTQQILATPQSSERFVYFLTSASVALLVRDGVRQGLAMGLVGYEGAVGLHYAFGAEPGIFTLMVQSPGTAWRMDGRALQDLARRRPDLLMKISRYMWLLAQEVAILSAFAQLSDVKPRLARWLLKSASRSRTNDLAMTQLHLADMLGVRRATVTLAAIELKQQGLLEYSRGKLQILDSIGLEAVANSAGRTIPAPNLDRRAVNSEIRPDA